MGRVRVVCGASAAAGGSVRRAHERGSEATTRGEAASQTGRWSAGGRGEGGIVRREQIVRYDACYTWDRPITVSVRGKLDASRIHRLGDSQSHPFTLEKRS